MFHRSMSVFSAFLMLMASTQAAVAAPEEHVVPLSELQKRVETAVEQKARDRADIERVLSYPAAARELAKYNVQQDQVRVAVAQLSDSELSRLAERARASEQDVQGGFIVGILALIGLIVVIIIVVAIVAEAAPAPAADVPA